MFFLLLLFAASLSAQPLYVYSEFARINTKGEVTAPAEPREILSPAIVRNGFTSFQIVVQVEPGTPFWLYVGQNPDDAVRITLYREAGDKLEPVELPFAGKTTETFWMDLWADRDAPVRRIKVEPQLNVPDADHKDNWILYPMEVRVVDAAVPMGTLNAKPLCDAFLPPRGPAPTLGAMHYRNQRQDATLALRLPPTEARGLMSICDEAPEDPESYLKIRDTLLRQH